MRRFLSLLMASAILLAGLLNPFISLSRAAVGETRGDRGDPHPVTLHPGRRPGRTCATIAHGSSGCAALCAGG